MVTVAMVSKISVFSENVTKTFNKLSVVLFSVSLTVFELFAIFYSGIFLSMGQFYPISDLTPQNYEFIAQNHKKARVLMGAINLLSREFSDR